jgi:hypothetical protein
LYPVGLSPIRPIWRFKKKRAYLFSMIPQSPMRKTTRTENGFLKMVCVQTLEIQCSWILDLSIVLQLFTAFGIFLSLSSLNGAPTNACQILHKEGAW